MNVLKLFAIFSLFIISVANSAIIEKRQTNIESLNNIQNLLQELEKANLNENNRPNKETERPVRDALRNLFVAFQQMASAYVGVLTSVGKSIGLPTIGKQTNGIQFLESSAPIGIKQIQENLRQFQDSVRDVSKAIQNAITREGPQERQVITTQVRKFLKLWSNQIQELSDQVTKAFGGLQAPGGSSITIPLPFIDVLQQFVRVFQDTFSELAARVTRIVSGNPTNPNERLPRQDSKPSQNSILNQLMPLIDNFQKSIVNLQNQLSRLLNPPKQPSN